MVWTNPSRPPRPGFRELGPAWISAIAALIAAVSGIGGFAAGRSTTSGDNLEPSQQQAPANPATGQKSASTNARTKASTSAKPPPPLSLVDMSPVGDTENAPSNSSVNVNAKHYAESLNFATQEPFCGLSFSDADATYQLDRKYRTLSMQVGLSDASPSGDTATFTFIVDGQQEGPAPTVGVGAPQSVDLNVSGALRVTLKETCSAPNATSDSQANVTAVWLNPTLSP